MARGIEELAEMQVTGPVQGGDMVMKPDQAPVGAAALLNKMSRQNTPGIFKLPMPDKQMPDFMKVAAEGVEQQTAKGDSINQMAGQLLRQGIDIRGMGMDEIITIYEQVFGSPGDVDQFGVSENLFPGNFTNKEQDVTLLPRNLKTGPDNPETELAYITDDEKALLALMNPGTPHEGPEGVPTYDKGNYVESGWGFLNDSPESSSESSNNSSGSYAYGDDVSGVDFSIPSSGSSSANGDVSGLDFLNNYPDQSLPASNDGSNDGTPTITTEDKKETMLDKGLNLLGGTTIGGMMKLTKGLDKVAQAWEEARVKKFLEGSVKDTDVGMGNLLAKLRDNPQEFGDWFAKRGDIFNEVFEGEKTESGDPVASLSDEDKFEFLVEKYTGNKQFDKTYNPKEYFKSESGESTAEYQKRMREKGVTAKELAQAQAEGKLGSMDSKTGKYNSGFTRANTAMIEEGRRRLEQEAGPAQDRHPGTKRPIEEKIAEAVTETTGTTNPLAGAFNVGGTMPYTHDVATGGVEMDVPLGRRFEIDKAGKYRGTTGGMDLNEAMQYATLGGYGQLEPFQQYLARRRKYLDEDEPQYFDEDGNVIYSGVT
jgi:hypothetical protein